VAAGVGGSLAHAQLLERRSSRHGAARQLVQLCWLAWSDALVDMCAVLNRASVAVGMGRRPLAWWQISNPPLHVNSPGAVIWWEMRVTNALPGHRNTKGLL
jgi:hypothetical protein